MDRRFNKRLIRIGFIYGYIVFLIMLLFGASGVFAKEVVCAPNDVFQNVLENRGMSPEYYVRSESVPNKYILFWANPFTGEYVTTFFINKYETCLLSGGQSDKFLKPSA